MTTLRASIDGIVGIIENGARDLRAVQSMLEDAPLEVTVGSKWFGIGAKVDVQGRPLEYAGTMLAASRALDAASADAVRGVDELFRDRPPYHANGLWSWTHERWTLVQPGSHPKYELEPETRVAFAPGSPQVLPVESRVRAAQMLEELRRAEIPTGREWKPEAGPEQLEQALALLMRHRGTYTGGNHSNFPADLGLGAAEAAENWARAAGPEIAWSSPVSEFRARYAEHIGGATPRHPRFDRLFGPEHPAHVLLVDHQHPLPRPLSIGDSPWAHKGVPSKLPELRDLRLSTSAQGLARQVGARAAALEALAADARARAGHEIAVAAEAVAVQDVARAAAIAAADVAQLNAGVTRDLADAAAVAADVGAQQQQIAAETAARIADDRSAAIRAHAASLGARG